MSTDYVHVRSITEAVGSGDNRREVTAMLGDEVPDSIPTARLRELREEGVIGPQPVNSEAPLAARADLDATATGPNPEGGPSSGSGQSAELPADAPNAADAEVGELAAFIDSNDLNAAQTVALAGDTPEGAAKVLEAERTASGGDGRSTVVKPLQKLAEGDGS